MKKDEFIRRHDRVVHRITGTHGKVDMPGAWNAKDGWIWTFRPDIGRCEMLPATMFMLESEWELVQATKGIQDG